VAVDQLGHLDGLLVVGDHVLGEGDVGVAWRRPGRRSALVLVPSALVAGGDQEGSGQRKQDPSQMCMATRPESPTITAVTLASREPNW
jgi:hypothetical protein